MPNNVGFNVSKQDYKQNNVLFYGFWYILRDLFKQAAAAAGNKNRLEAITFWAMPNPFSSTPKTEFSVSFTFLNSSPDTVVKNPNFQLIIK